MGFLLILLIIHWAGGINVLLNLFPKFEESLAVISIFLKLPYFSSVARLIKTQRQILVDEKSKTASPWLVPLPQSEMTFLNFKLTKIKPRQVECGLPFGEVPPGKSGASIGRGELKENNSASKGVCNWMSQGELPVVLLFLFYCQFY